jgi:DNA-binding MarR family transcriptional regulator
MLVFMQETSMIKSVLLRIHFSMQKYIHLLERLGLSASEQKIYLTLLLEPYMTISEIARKV